VSGQLGVLSEWHRGEREFTIGVEEEAFLLEPGSGAIAHRSAEVLPRLREALGAGVTAETHDSAFELVTPAYPDAAAAAAELHAMRRRAVDVLAGLGLEAGVAGTHPTATWRQIQVSGEERYEDIHDAMRELARREPTFALHVHVGIENPDRAVLACDRLRVHLPLLLALSANSPYWQGRDSRLASARTPLFQSFPRTGIPRPFGDWQGYAEAIAPLVDSGAIPDPSHLWWDIRPRPATGTIEIRIMDAQTEIEETATLTALVACLARVELEDPMSTPRAVIARETIEENRFRAARDGTAATLIDAEQGTTAPVSEIVAEVRERCREHAEDLGCAAELEGLDRLLEANGAVRQRRAGGEGPDFGAVLGYLSTSYAGAPSLT
jgi:glutamate---cysteine ligase / carboxylate-amine ligase